MANFDDLLNSTPAGEQGAQQESQLSKEEYAAKKKAEREEVFALSDKTAMEVAGDGGEFQRYLNVQAANDRYSAVNALLILAQKPEAARLGTFDHWKKQNCSVKPGQKAISILEPQEYTKDDGTPGIGYAVRKVFDISQVDTSKLRSAPTPNFTERQLLQALVNSSPVAIVGVENLSEDMGAMRHDERIDVRKGMGFDDTFRSLTREVALADLEKRDVHTENSEFTAYCASYLLCNKYGADTQSFNFEPAPDIFADMDVQSVKGELSQIRDAAESISGKMARQLEAVQKTAKNNEAR